MRLIAIGPVYRKDNLDLTHTPMFHQVEGLVVGKGITLADLKGTLSALARALFGAAERPLPSELLPVHRAECRSRHPLLQCEGAGCATVQAHGLDRDPRQRHGAPGGVRGRRLRPREITGFAFGMGVERVAMIKCGIDDIRLFYENDLRFLEQFGS